MRNGRGGGRSKRGRTGARTPMKQVVYAPEGGDIVWISRGPRSARKQAARRPAVVLSPQAYNAKVGLAVLCPITAHIKGSPFEVSIPPGLPVEGAVLADQ